ncbi:MAG TPA: carbon-nitrogen hydrolase family protein [Desulfotomaculum sp.]|uniref:carbon-nitrogen hydrolase family protein n=1 Tax=Desulfofundulus thermobenzoicus TaxID=29376 RepID=UPI00176D020C|nr:carbon-nitrogen hydrolase family protein [Desulfofundulus thermobenzoicus]HHW44765.1 carbon-nitrogen hydrolase family protein [Desulfotomaculum sp.]
MSSLKLAIVQFPRDTTNLNKNITLMQQYFSQITAGAEVILLPEDWLGATVIDWNDYRRIVTELFHTLKDSSSRPLLVSGAQYVRAEGNIYSRGVVLGGALSAPVAFEKHFPSRAIGERGYVKPGSLLPVVEHRGIALGMAVCVDIMYPELVRGLTLRGALLVLNPANIPATRMPMWQGIGIARACENTVFVATANNTATAYPDGREVLGESFVVYPDGYTLLACGREPGVFYFDLDLSRLDRVRRRWPYLEDVRTNREIICRWYYG